MKINKLTYYLLLLLLIPAFRLDAQQFPLTSEYVFNPYALNPAEAGILSKGEVFLNYRKDWTGIDNSPKTFRANGNGCIFEDKMWLGGELMLDKADVFQRFKGSLSYTYRLQMANNQFLNFGLWGDLYQNSLDVGGVNGDLDDPLLKDKSRVNKTTFNAGFALIYQWNRFNIGFGMPTLFRTKDAYLAEASGNFAFEQEYLFHTSTIFTLSDMVQLQPFFVWRRTTNHPTSIDLSATLIFQNRFWLTTLYRNSGTLALGAGIELTGNFVINYLYEIGLSGINSKSGGAHEITVGYRVLGNRDFSFEKHAKKKKSAKKGAYYNRNTYPTHPDNYKPRK